MLKFGACEKEHRSLAQPIRNLIKEHKIPATVITYVLYD
jgi:hypothetical protein